VYTVYVYMYMSTLKYSMRDIPQGVQLLYTMNNCVYTARSYSTTVREWSSDPLLNPKPAPFRPEAPLLMPQFQVDKTL